MKEWHLYKGATDDLGIVVSGATAEVRIPNAAKLIVTFAGTTVAVLDKDGNLSLTGGSTFNHFSISSGATVDHLVVSSGATIHHLNVTSEATIAHLNVATLEVTGNINAVCHNDAVISNNNEIVFN